MSDPTDEEREEAELERLREEDPEAYWHRRIEAEGVAAVKDQLDPYNPDPTLVSVLSDYVSGWEPSDAT